jgi:DNA helicase-2/ATP-dependent DNA helicase PcrA
MVEALKPAQLLMLGDANQLIYTFVPGVSPERFEDVRRAAEVTIELEPASHRDPTGVIPAVADAVRRRDFGHDALKVALVSGQLVLVPDVAVEAHADTIEHQILQARLLGSRSIGIFAHSNQSVIELADTLHQLDIDHVLIGIPEAHSEGLAAMRTLCLYGGGLASNDDVRRSLALYLTSVVRGRVPELAHAFMNRIPLPEHIRLLLQSLESELKEAANGTVDDLVAVAIQAWDGLAMATGRRTWRRAASHFVRLIRRIQSMPVDAASLALLNQLIEAGRNESLVDLDFSERGSISLMNFHQTKGREADTVIHVFRMDDYVPETVHPFEEASRLLNVSISRARKRVVLVLPPAPYPLIAPFSSL